MDIVSVINVLGNNKVFVAVTMLVMNVGSRYLLSDFTDVQNKIMSSEVFKQLVLFSIFFAGSRDVMVSMMLTFAFNFILKVLLNEKHRFNLVPSFLKQISVTDMISEAEYKKAKSIVEKYEQKHH